MANFDNLINSLEKKIEALTNGQILTNGQMIMKIMEKMRVEKWQESIKGKTKDEIGEMVLKNINDDLSHSIRYDFYPEVKESPSEVYNIILNNELTFNQKVIKIFGARCWKNLTYKTQGGIYGFFEKVCHPPINLTPPPTTEDVHKSMGRLAKKFDKLSKEIDTVLNK